MDHNFDDIIAYHENYAREEGEKAGILDTAKNMYANNISLDMISKCAKLSIKELQELLNNYTK